MSQILSNRAWGIKHWLDIRHIELFKSKYDVYLTGDEVEVDVFRLTW